MWVGNAIRAHAPGRATDDIVLVADELVTDAILRADGIHRLRLEIGAAAITLAVQDRSPLTTVVREAITVVGALEVDLDADADPQGVIRAGYGSRIVRYLATGCGVTADGAVVEGTTIWATFSIRSVAP